MTDHLRSPKLRAWHLDRSAFVYVRQSTPQQVIDHQESTDRQYALADRAVALGWPADRVTHHRRPGQERASRSRAAPDSRDCWPRSPSTTSA